MDPWDGDLISGTNNVLMFSSSDAGRMGGGSWITPRCAKGTEVETPYARVWPYLLLSHLPSVLKLCFNLSVWE